MKNLSKSKLKNKRADDMDFFFVPNLFELPVTCGLDEANSKHCAQVLRYKKGEIIRLTDGKGGLATAEIVSPHTKHTCIRILCKESVRLSDKPAISLAVSSLKNADRIEWLLSKSTEIGIAAVYLMKCERTQRMYPNKKERFQNIMLSSMLQSQRVYLPQLFFSSFENTLAEFSRQKKYIAHCEKNITRVPLSQIEKPNNEVCIFIGPEGDFSPKEIELATEKYHCLPVSLSEYRLRTETAAIYSIVYFTI